MAEGLRVSYYLVEDDPAVADSLQALLLGAGHDAEVFSTAEQFIDRGPPRGDDTVVVDLGLPGLSGAVLLKWMTALADPPRIVVISGQSSGVIRREVDATFEVRVLRKPPADDWLTMIAG